MILALIFILGLAVGSFINVLIDRLPKSESVVAGRSHCDYCGRTLRWFELIPVASWIIQGGRCRRCHKRLSIQYPLIELTTGLIYPVIYLIYPPGPDFMPQFMKEGGAMIVATALLVIFVADFKYQIIPDSMVVLGLIGAIVIAGVDKNNVVTGICASLFFLFIYLITRRRGMGFGDVKLVFLMGFLAGFPKIIVALYVAFLTGASAGVILILGDKKKLKSKISFGPFLVLGLIVALIWGDKLSLWFLKMI